MRSAARVALEWTEQGVVPDALIRAGIRRLCRARLEAIGAADPALAAEHSEAFVAALAGAPIALLPNKANDQHYEIPAAFYANALGRHRKYSACHFAAPTTTLDEAEAAALAITVERAGLADGQRILELGCGWGSLTLWMAERFPRARITAVSNAHSQRVHVEDEAARRGLRNVEVVTSDMNDFDSDARFDRIVSVEMFEHMRNWPALFARIERWLAPRGRFFMHVFVHRLVPYAFEVHDASDWMSEHFFSGGMMPSDELALRTCHPLALERRWRWSGLHYARTANAWLGNTDANRASALAILADVHGAQAAAQWLQRWRVFFMACAELFAYDGGREWFVSHYRFARPGDLR